MPTALSEGSGAPNIGGGATRYVNVGGKLLAESTEANVQLRIRDMMSVQYLFVNISLNSLTGASTITSRKNSVNGTLTVSIPAGSTGIFEDLTHIDTVVSGDEYNMIVVAGAGTSLGIIVLAVSFIHANTLTHHCISAQSDNITQGTTLYYPVNGVSVGLAAETTVQLTSRISGTFTRLKLYITANGITSASTGRFRKNGGNGTQTVTIPAGTTGAFEDVTNSDSFGSADKVNTSITAGSGGTSLAVILIQLRLQNTFFVLMHHATTSVTFGLTRYTPCSGGASPQTTETPAQVTARFSFRITNLFVSVQTSNLNGVTTVRTRVNGSNGSLSLSVPASTTGFFENTSNIDSVVGGDNINYQIVAGGSSGTITLRSLAVSGLTAVALEFLVSKDFPMRYVKKGKAQELVSKFL